MSDNIIPQLPKAPLSRRVAAFSIDALVVWFLSAIISNNWFTFILFFMVLWIITRVLVVYKNYGQSIGHYALDMKVLDTRYQRNPGILDLSKREGILALSGALAMLGISNLTSGNAAVLLLIMPLFLDFTVALVDIERYQQAFHDRIAQTIVVGTMRGYSLDIKVKRLVDEAKRYVRR
ncbi:MAG: RDD family protein [Okeania sp. SIO2G4]|uniref:RDD family protein n=1 Tax=unclassified Okeania TaxID=2634635 RepID=UPI0013B95571|nr:MULTISPECIES: RDD family protein [unclassified Okeania]NEP38316.1 RDD family protein [Okeania sp. SIO2H7]NEP74853.1 RDD family protein [Okeania sp. SIO2G5]NEP95960.1 RDD family protein [Okeania sp. SIO2F5]NEQ91547.1 RDD family protein [Okeania sp. SIO2G4]